LGELGVIFGMCAIYTGIYVSVGIYQADFHILTAIAAFIGLFIGCAVGIIIQDIGRSMIYVCVSAVSAIAIAVTLIVLPPFLAGEYEMVNYALLPTMQLITLPAIFATMFSLFGTALGYFIGDSLK
ncbi:hypothetical protein KEJ15_08030, partial [Candidatus Bathyarchaeota archaeon]|nr:hypothetical protein [Candidatus Bathyarchaeota archaeon]